MGRALQNVLTLLPPTVISSVASLSVADKLAESRNLLDCRQETRFLDCDSPSAKRMAIPPLGMTVPQISAAALTSEWGLVVFSSSSETVFR